SATSRVAGSAILHSLDRQPDRERRAQRSPIRPLDLAAVLLGDLPRDREAEAGALRLRREELFEEPGHSLLGDPAACVGDGDLDRLAVESAGDGPLPPP